MAYITVNQIIDVFRDIADRHLMINDFGNGPTYNIGAADELKFPYLWVENGDINTVFSVNGMREKRLTFNLYLMDKINKGDDNFDEIISDTEFILSGIIQEFSQLPFYVQNKLSLFQDINLTPVVEATDDNVNGWQATISLKIPIPYTYCEMPIRPFVTPVIPQPCPFEPISIQNSLGCEFIEITEYPTGGISLLPTVNLNSTTVQPFKNITINDENIASISQIDDCSIEVNLQSKFPILLTNGQGCLIDSITGSTSGGSIHTLPTIDIFDGLSSLGNYPIIKQINLNTECGVDDITTSVDGCELNIDIASCFPISVVNRYDCLIDKINTYPGPKYTLPSTTFTDDDGSFGTEFIGTSINIIGGTISAITTSNSGCDTNIILNEPICEDCFPISIKNSEGCELDVIEECPSPCTGNTWTVVVSAGASVTNLNLLDCNGEVYEVIPSLGPGTYSYCHFGNIQPTAGSIFGLVIMTNTNVPCTIEYQYELPDITVVDGASFSASTPSPSNIIVSGASVNSVNANGCELTINVSCETPAPSATTSGVYVFEANIAVTASINDVAVLNETPNNIVFLGEKGTTYMTTVGNRHGAAIKNFVGGTGGELWVWGLDINGSIGGATNYQWSQIGVDSDWDMVVAGGNSTLAIKNGALYGTGLNTSGQLGDGTTTNKSVFTQIGVDTDWEFIETNGVTSIAIKGGALYACGSNIDYMTGNGTTEAGNTTTWTLVNSAETWTYVAVGRYACMAVTSSGKLYSWGNNIGGGTAQGTTAGDTTSPTQVGSDTDWLQCAIGNQTSYAIKTDGTLWGGGQANGTIWGNNTTVTIMTQEGLGDTDWDYVDCASANGVFARKTNGTLWGGGAVFANMLTSFSNTLTQIGTDTNWERNYTMHTGGFTGENCFIKS